MPTVKMTTTARNLSQNMLCNSIYRTLRKGKTLTRGEVSNPPNVPELARVVNTAGPIKKKH
jgi:hypothetical protein